MNKFVGRLMALSIARMYGIAPEIAPAGATLTFVSEYPDAVLNVVEDDAKSFSTSIDGHAVTVFVDEGGHTGTALKAALAGDVNSAAIDAIMSVSGVGGPAKWPAGQYNLNSPVAFQYIGTLTTKTITENNERIDVTTVSPDAADRFFRETLPGMKSFDISGDGIGDDSVVLERLASLSNAADSAGHFRVTDPGVCTYEGKFAVISYSKDGPVEGAVTFSVSLESTGEITREIG